MTRDVLQKFDLFDEESPRAIMAHLRSVNKRRESNERLDLQLIISRGTIEIYFIVN